MAKQERNNAGRISLSKFQAALLLIGFLVAILFVGLLAGLLKSPSCPLHPQTSPKPDTRKVGPVKATQDTHRGKTETVIKQHKEAGIWTNHRLPRNLVPVHYDLVLYPDFYNGSDQFYGNVSIQINVTGADASCVLIHIKDLRIIRSRIRRLTEATDDGTTKKDWIPVGRNFSYPHNEYWVMETSRTIPAGAVIRVDLQFQGSLTNGLAGLYRSRYFDSTTGEVRYLATSKFQPTDARKAFPCLDEPGFKSTFNVTLIHRPNFTALSNMPQESTTNSVNGLVATRFQKSVPMVTYLACFIVCDFAYKESQTTNGIPLRVFAVRDMIDQADFALNITGRILELYEQTFGLPYPLPKLDQIAIPDFVSGAMEHWGLITYRETMLLYNEREASVSNKQRVAIVIAHELAHMWFGNLVTMNWWNDLWLNEGFASYVEYIGVDHVQPDWNMKAQFLTEDMQLVMSQDATLSSHPIVVPVEHPDQITEVFDIISYSKGASVLRMLESVLGMENFKKGLQMYMKKYQYSIAVTSDLWNCLSQVDGAPDVNAVMKTWTEQMGFPVVDVIVTGSGVRLTQSRFLIDPTANKTQPPSDFNYIWQIPLKWIDSVGHSGLLWLKEKQATLSLTQDSRNGSDWIKFNANGSSYVRVNYMESHWKHLAEVLQKNPKAMSTSDRSNLLDDAFSLAKAGHINYSIPLELIKYMEKETEFVPWKTVEVNTAYIREMLQYSTHFGKWKRYISSLLKPVLRQIGLGTGGTHNEQLMRISVFSMACVLGNQECLDNVTHVFRAWIHDGQYIVPSLRGVVYRYGMRTAGNEWEWDRLWEHYVNTTTPQEKNRLLLGLAQAREAWLLNRLLVNAMDDQKIRSQDFFSAISYMTTNPLGRSLVWDWARVNWPKLVDRFNLNNRYLGRMIPGIVHFFNTPFQLQEVESFFSRHPIAGAGERGRSQALDQIRANIAWMDRNIADIGHWLDNQDLA